MTVATIYRQLAINTFHPQMIADIENNERVIEVCQTELELAGYPCTDENEDDWMEYVYMACEIWEIAINGFVYRREKDANYNNSGKGYNMVLYTRANHPAFAE